MARSRRKNDREWRSVGTLDENETSLHRSKRNGKFQQLNVEDFAMSEVRDAVWEQYDRDGDKGALATKHALFFRSIFVPSLACALSPARDTNGEVHGAFADQLEQRLKRRLASRPLEMLSFVQTLVLAKRE